jgi:hypothetical protein
MPDQTKRVAVVEDLDTLLAAFDRMKEAAEFNARYAAMNYAEKTKPEDREAYKLAKQDAVTVTALRTQLTQSLRVLLPGEVDRLYDKG